MDRHRLVSQCSTNPERNKHPRNKFIKHRNKYCLIQNKHDRFWSHFTKILRINLRLRLITAIPKAECKYIHNKAIVMQIALYGTSTKFYQFYNSFPKNTFQNIDYIIQIKLGVSKSKSKV